MCNIKKHELYLGKYYEELQNFNFIESDGEKDAAEFPMINSDLLYMDLEDSNGVSNEPVASTIINNLLLPNEQLYESCS